MARDREALPINPEGYTSTQIEQKVCEYARDEYQMTTYKFTSPGHRGVPDRIIITQQGLIAFVEFFTEDNDPLRPEQYRELNRLKARKCDVFTVCDVRSGKVLIDTISDVRKYQAVLAGMGLDENNELKILLTH